jgi:hypothetical protein
MPELEKEIATYKRLLPDLESHHKGKWVVIHGDDFVGAFDTFNSAASEAVQRFDRGPYMIRQVGAPDIVLPASVMYRLEPADA